jgi:hypothetical protein
VAGRFWMMIVLIGMAGALYAIQHTRDSQPGIIVPAIAGDTVFVRTQAGTRLLIDTANDAPALLAFLGQHASLLHRHIVDVVIITQPTEGSVGGLDSLVRHGVSHIVWTPASTDYGHTFCGHYPQVHCLFVDADTHWNTDEVSVAVVASHTVALSWPHGSLLINHAPMSETVASPLRPAPQGIVGMIYPWRAQPDPLVWAQWPSQFVLYSDGYHTERPALLSMAQRRHGHEQLLHEDLDGTLFVPMTADAGIFRSTKDDS